jgi:hypothetical protein
VDGQLYLLHQPFLGAPQLSLLALEAVKPLLGRHPVLRPGPIRSQPLVHVRGNPNPPLPVTDLSAAEGLILAVYFYADVAAGENNIETNRFCRFEMYTASM